MTREDANALWASMDGDARAALVASIRQLAAQLEHKENAPCQTTASTIASLKVTRCSGGSVPIVAVT